MRTDNNTKIEFKNNRDWIVKELKKPRAKRLIKAYIAMMQKGEVDFNILGNIYRPTEKIPEASVKRLFRQKETQNMINEELQKALIGNNVTMDYLIEQRRDLIDKSKDNKRLDITLKAIEGFEDMYNMRSQNRVSNTITETVNYKQLIESPETTKKQEITASRTKNLPTESEKESE